MAETEKLDALGLIQEQLYADIADFIVRDSVIRAIGEDNPDVSRNFWLTLVDNPEGIAKIFYEHLERLGRTAEFEHAGNLLTLFGGTDVIDFKRIYAFREDDFGCTDSSEASLERAKKLLIPLIEEEIPTQKLICMLCYCETHKKYEALLYREFFEALFKQNRGYMWLTLESKHDFKKKSDEYIKEAAIVILQSAADYHSKYYTYDSDIFPIRITISYSVQDVEADLKSHLKKWYYKVSADRKYVLGNIDSLKYHLKNAWSTLSEKQFKKLTSKGEDGKRKTILKRALHALNATDIFFSTLEKEPIIPAIIHEEFCETLQKMSEHKYNNSKMKADCPIVHTVSLITDDTLLWCFGNFFLLMLLTLALLKNADKKWNSDYLSFCQKSVQIDGVPEMLLAYAYRRMTQNGNCLNVLYNENMGLKQKETNLTEPISKDEFCSLSKWLSEQ